LVRGALTEWRKERVEIADYKREKKEYKELCGIKKREENKRWEEEAEESKTEEQVWRIEKGGNENECNEWIGMKEWEEYFREVLGGVDTRKSRKNDLEGEGGKEREREGGWKRRGM